MYDAVIVGGGPGGLATALTLGRSRKHVLLCDAGPRRNEAATHIHNFVTRDGTSPQDFRRVGREQLRSYPNVEVCDVPVERIEGERGAFHVTLGSPMGSSAHSGQVTVVDARRVVLCTGMIDVMLPIEGFAELWGKSIFQCPYCHGWEERGKKWAYLAQANSLAHFPEMMFAWTEDVVVLTNASVEIPGDVAEALALAGGRVESRRISRLEALNGRLQAVVLADGEQIPCDVLFSHPPQRQVDLVSSLNLEVGAEGYVIVDPMTRETSIPGIYAVGDLTSRTQAAIVAASTGMQAGAVLNHDLTRARI